MTPVVQLSKIVVRNWLVALGLFLLFSALGIAWLANQTPKYEIGATVAEKKDDLTLPTGGLSSLTGGLLGLAEQPSGINDLQEAIYSPDLAELLVTKYGFDRVIFRDRWDPALRRWKPAPGIVPRVISTIRDLFGVPVKNDVTSADMQRYLSDITFVESDVNSDNSLVRFYYPDRNEGRQILETILTEADSQARLMKRQQTEARLRYLYARLRQTQLTKQIDVLATLIQRLETQNVILNADRSFTVNVLSPPRASLQILRPRYPLVLGLIIIASAFLALTVVWSLAVIRGQ